MNRLTLERHQVWIYLAAISCGLVTGANVTANTAVLEPLIWPILGMLLYATFVQVPLLEVGTAFRDRRFVVAVVLGNFVFIPLLVWAALVLLPDNPPLKLGVLLVLLVPCTDWFVTFAQVGRGNAARAIAITPINLLLQILLLPLFIGIWLPAANWQAAVFLDITLLPPLLLLALTLVAGAITGAWAQRSYRGRAWQECMGWLPVPLLAMVLFLVSTTQAGTALESAETLLAVLPLFVIFPIAVALAARILTHCLALPMDAGRTLAFSMGTRNSFVVLPIALALPTGWELTAVVIVFQSLIELLGMVFFLWWLPTHLFRE